ncbi:uncharacterized protein [Anoplolepis gracilipes]|uniref:uncharacterized protein n=1 Tax=Anoplolepis gracilipes TaxID=354296 RepID=UPI003B9F6BCD
MVLYALSVFTIMTSVLLCSAEEYTLPVTTCKRNSTDYSNCLKVALEESWPRFVKGLPEFDFPRWNPFFYQNGRLVVNRDGVLIRGTVENATIFGFTSMRFLDVRPHFMDDVFRLEIDALIPKVFVNVYAAGEINVAGIRLSGKGHVHITLHESRFTWDMTGHVKNDTWTIEHFPIFMTIEKFLLHFIFFDGGKELGDLFEVFANEFWPSLYRAIWPMLVSQLIDPEFTDISNRLFSKVPFSKVFP